ncbi:MAG: asparagine synthase (glutamine-hydrolyzing) [Nitrospinae bacterium]|nr:asparagine synthase (glutamine-hydrolyzing) [Nitrospinota bacterium]
MCGIAGFYDNALRTEGDGRLERMTAILRHRGPDGEGEWREGGAALGHRRLAIIDPATGAQPMVSACGRYVISYNGELYNYPELKQLLAADYQFRTASDTEVLLAAFAKWGEGCFEKLNGIFAVAIYDRGERRLVLARDIFGVKPLYHARSGGTLYFASEMKAILAAEPGLARLSRAGLAAALEWRYFPAPLTPFEGIAKMRPGHLMSIGKDGTAREACYAPPSAAPWGGGRAEALDRLQRLTDDAVRRQLVADVPVGILLSGGVDSALLASFAVEHVPQKMTAFTVGFQGNFDKDETAAAAETAALLGLSHEAVTVKPGGFMELMERLVWHLEEPAATTSAVPLFLLSEQIARTHKVVLSGQGADELWGGYPRHFAEALRRNFAPLTPFVPGFISGLPLGEPLRKAAMAAAEGNEEERYCGMRRHFDPDERAALLGAAAPPYRDHLSPWGAALAGKDTLSRALYRDARTQLPDDLLLYTDKAAMAHGLEVRVPFLDTELASFAESLPPSFKVRGLRQKYLLKKMAERRLPAAIVRRKKIGFETPVEGWFRRELAGPVRETLCGPGARLREILGQKAVDRTVERHLSGRGDCSRRLFMLFAFEMWLRRFGVSY